MEAFVFVEFKFINIYVGSIFLTYNKELSQFWIFV